MPESSKNSRAASKTSNWLKSYMEKPYGKLTVIGHGGYRNRKNGKRYSLLLVVCECGNKLCVEASNIKSGNTQSCGCKRSETVHKQRWRGAGRLSGTYLCTMKRNAECRGLSFEISAEYAWQLFVEQDGRCALTGIQLLMDPFLHQSRRNKKSLKRQTASLDRINSKLGYIPGNVRWVHKKINLMRLDMTDDQLLKWCLRLLRHRKRMSNVSIQP